MSTPRGSKDLPAGATAPQWYSANGWDGSDSRLTPGAAIVFEIAFDAGLDGLTTQGNESHLFEALPSRFASRYDDAFFERFVPALRRVYDWAISNPEELTCTCTADEIALEVLVQMAQDWALFGLEVAAENPEQFPLASPSDATSLSEFQELLVADSDVLFLWDWEDDGIEDDEAFMRHAGIGNALKFENWFVPFGDR